MKTPLPILLVVAAVSVALGCANGVTPYVAAAKGTAERHASLEQPRMDKQTFRLGIWEFDLLALDLEPRGTTFRMLDFKILKLLEIGAGADYHSFSLVEMPDLLNLITTRHEGSTSEHRLVDLQMLALSALRLDEESARESETHVLKVPVVGSLYGHEVDGSEESYKALYLIRWDGER